MGTTFGHLSKYAPSIDKLVECPLYDISWDDDSYPTLLVVSATNSNRQFVTAQLKVAASADAQARNRHMEAGRLTAQMIDDANDALKPIYAKYILKGWKNVRDDRGQQVPWTEEEGLVFLRAIPVEIWDEFVKFVKNPANFSEATAVEVIAKN